MWVIKLRKYGIQFHGQESVKVEKYRKFNSVGVNNGVKGNFYSIFSFIE